MLVRELIQRVQSGYNKGVQSDDARFTNRHIYNKLLTSRQRLIAQQVKKRQFISDWNYIVLPCVELIEVDGHACPCIPQIGCKVWRTKYPLPKPLTDLSKHMIAWVFSIENSVRIDETTREAYVHNSGNKYTSNKTKFILEGQHAYFYGKNVPKVVKIKILPEDPMDAIFYPSMCPCEDCGDCISPLDKEFPIDADLNETLIDMAIEELVGKLRGQSEDKTNNTSDDTDVEFRSRGNG